MRLRVRGWRAHRGVVGVTQVFCNKKGLPGMNRAALTFWGREYDAG